MTDPARAKVRRALYDVVVVGGGPAGLSAALLLGRARRRVLVCDTGRGRNAASHALHAFISRDGVNPKKFRRIAQAQLSRYSSVQLMDCKVTDAKHVGNEFQVTLRGRPKARCRAIILATGRIDILPPLQGAKELLGRGLYPCPYCDGWEKRDQIIAVYGNNSKAAAVALELLDWSKVVLLCTNGPSRLAKKDSARLARHGITVRTEAIDRLESDKGNLSAIRFKRGEIIPARALFFYPQQYQQSQLAQRLGCTFKPDGSVACDGHSRTGVPGLYVAGNMRCGLQLAIVAAAEGAEAAYLAHSMLQVVDHR